MEAVRSSSKTGKGEDAAGGDGGKHGGMFRCTHQPVEHLIQHDPQTPPVHRRTVGVALQHLWSQVLWGPTKGMHDATYSHPFFTESKVSQHHVTLAVQQDVLWFEVPDRHIETK